MINVDTCIDYIEEKNCFYLAKEGQVVYFASLTGRECDKEWIKQTLSETMRVITATRLSQDALLMTGDLIAAFQETERVYEFGMKSQFGTAKGAFNYNKHGSVNMAAAAAMAATDVLMSKDVTAITYSLAQHLIVTALNKLKYKAPANEVKETIVRYFTGVGYDYKVGSRRPMVSGRKQIVFMMSGKKPKDVVYGMLNEKDVIAEIVRRIK